MNPFLNDCKTKMNGLIDEYTTYLHHIPAPCITPSWNLVYYIHTEKYSPKSYVVNFRTQISSSQSEERTMVFTREKNDTSNQKPQCEFRAKIPTFYCSLKRRFAGIQRE